MRPQTRLYKSAIAVADFSPLDSNEDASSCTQAQARAALTAREVTMVLVTCLGRSVFP